MSMFMFMLYFFSGIYLNVMECIIHYVYFSVLIIIKERNFEVEKIRALNSITIPMISIHLVWKRMRVEEGSRGLEFVDDEKLSRINIR